MPPALPVDPSVIARADWVSRLADQVIAEAERRGTKVVCASGISPSGPVHLGNFRELITPHLVADEVRRRGVPVDHIVSWDDFDRFRRVPGRVPGVDESWAGHVGKPLTAVPAPPGSAHDSWAAHFRAEIEAALVDVGIEYRGISQTIQYRCGAYREKVLLAMSRRTEIDGILGRFRTLDREAGATPDQDDADEDRAGGRLYSPFKPYCSVCGTDFTTVTGYDDVTTRLVYACRCGYAESVLLSEFTNGKLVWKVDWPMRWSAERVVFEPSGVDHQSPGSSFVVGKALAPLFGWERPIGPMYAFVGIRGMAKMSSSRGGVPTPADALRVMEPQLLRWQYARRRPNQSFDIDLGPALARLYDEWDALDTRMASGLAQGAETTAWLRACGTATVVLPRTSRPVSYRTLASIVDVTTGDQAQTLRIVSALDPERPVGSLDELRPRLDRVAAWVTTLDEADRTIPRAAPATELIEALGADDRAAIALLLGGGGGLPAIEEAWTLDGLTNQVYGVPKVRRGLAADARAKGDAGLAAAQRAFFTLLYRLLIDAETGPRLPTLLLALGPERTRALLGA